MTNTPDPVMELHETAGTATPNLPVPQNGGLAVPSEDPWDKLRGGDWDGSDAFVEAFGVSLPRIRTDFGKGGTGLVYPDDVAVEKMSFVLLAYPPSRAFWIKSLDEDPTPGLPDCKSHDMVVPDESSPALQSDTCASCPHSQWKTDENGKRERPRCSEAVNCFIYEPEIDSFFWLQFKGTALAPFRSHISAFKSKRLPAFAAFTNVTLNKKEEGALKWLVPSFSIGDPLTPELVAPLRSTAKMAMESWTQVAEVMATEGSAAEEEPFPKTGAGDAAVDAKGNPVDCPGHAEGDHVNECIQAAF